MTWHASSTFLSKNPSVLVMFFNRTPLNPDVGALLPSQIGRCVHTPLHAGFILMPHAMSFNQSYCTVSVMQHVTTHRRRYSWPPYRFSTSPWLEFEHVPAIELEQYPRSSIWVLGLSASLACLACVAACALLTCWPGRQAGLAGRAGYHRELCQV